MSGAPWRAVTGGIEIALRLTPRGGADRLEGFGADAEGRPLLLAWVAAAPTDGEANAALVRLLAKAAGAPKGAVEIVSGVTARVKRVRISGKPEALAAALLRALA